MPSAEVVNAAKQEHARFNGSGRAGKSSRTPSETTEPLAEGGVEALDVGCVNLTTGLSRLQQACNQVFATLRNTSLYCQFLALASFNNLHDGHIGPGDFARCPSLT